MTDHIAEPSMPARYVALDALNELAKVHALSYASPHHFTMSVNGLQELVAAIAALEAEPQGWRPIETAPKDGSKRAAALALYRPPFKFRMGYIHDAGGHMVADQDGFGEGSKVFDSIAARVRGWGRIGYLPDAEALQDEVGAVIADALTAYWAAAPQPQQEQSNG